MCNIDLKERMNVKIKKSRFDKTGFFYWNV